MYLRHFSVCRNILFFAILSNTEINQEAAAYTSVTITFLLLLLIILYHVYTYTSAFSSKHLHKLLKTDPKPKRKDQSPPPDDDTHRFHELPNMFDQHVNYKLPLRQNPAELTYSVIDSSKPCLPPPQPEEANIQKIRGTVETVQIEVDKGGQVHCRICTVAHACVLP